MKKRLPKLILGGLALFLVLDLMLGFKLAQPEASGPNTDRFIGFHLVPEQMLMGVGKVSGSGTDSLPDPLYPKGHEPDRSHWEEYGSESVTVGGLGSVSMPRMILKGVWDAEEHRFDFPGMEGYNCFLAALGEGNDRQITGYTDMTENKLDIKITDEGEENYLTSALYLAPRAIEAGEKGSHWTLTAYRVYQMEDGTVYLDGTGNSYGSPGFTIKETSEFTTTVNGKQTRKLLSIEFSLKDVHDLKEVSVIWFDEADTILSTEVLALGELEGEYDLTAPAGAAWGMVRETTDDDKVTRTPLDPDYNGFATHKLITLDERGIGEVCWLRWNRG